MHRCYRLTHTPFACTRSFAWRGTRLARSATRPKLVVRMGPQCGEDDHPSFPCNTSESLPIMHDTLVHSEPVYSEQSLSRGMAIVLETEKSFVHENTVWIQLSLCAAAIRRVHFPARVTGPVLTQSTILTLAHHHTHRLRADSIRSCLMGQTPGCRLRRTCSSQ